MQARWYRVVKPASRRQAAGVSDTVRVRVFKWYRLDGLDMVDSVRFEAGSAVVNGNSYPHSVMNEDNFWWEHNPWGEWNLGRKCADFKSTVGLADSSPSDYEVGFTSYRDGAASGWGTLGVGSSKAVNFSVKGTFRLRLEDNYVAGETGSRPATGVGVLGNARVLCTAKP